MSPAGWGWLVLAFPLAGTILIALGWRVLPGRLPGWIATSTIFLSFLAGLAMFTTLEEIPPQGRHLVGSAWQYGHTSGVHVDLAILVDPIQPALRPGSFRHASASPIMPASGSASTTHAHETAWGVTRAAP